MAGCNCGSAPNSGASGFLIAGGKRSKRRTKNTRRRSNKNRTKQMRKRKGRKGKKSRKRRVMKGGLNSDLLGDQTTNPVYFASKMVGTPFIPPLTWQQPADIHYGPGNKYLV